MKRLLLGMIVIFLLQLLFSSIQNHDHFALEPIVESSFLVNDQGEGEVIDFNLHTDISPDQFMESFHQGIDCCQEMDMSSCSMGCYFVPLANSIVINHLKTESPLDWPITWHSYFSVSDNPPPRLFV